MRVVPVKTAEQQATLMARPLASRLPGCPPGPPRPLRLQRAAVGFEGVPDIAAHSEQNCSQVS